MQLNFKTLDVFTTTRYLGNPVAIIFLNPRVTSSGFLPQATKQAIAREFNLSEIVFIHLPDRKEGQVASQSLNLIQEQQSLAAGLTRITIDIFTSHAEIPFAGHPTVGAAYYLLQIVGLRGLEILHTKAGPIPVSIDARTGHVWAQVPQTFHIHQKTHSLPTPLQELVSEEDSAVAQPITATTSIVAGMSFIFIRLPSLAALAAAAPKYGNLNGDTYDPSPLDPSWRVGLVTTMYFVATGSDVHGARTYRTRMFGTREDPGTGSASSALACWLALLEQEREGGLLRGDGDEPGDQAPDRRVKRFAFTQGVEMGKTCDIGVEVHLAALGTRSNGIDKVLLSGCAVPVINGTLEIDGDL